MTMSTRCVSSEFSPGLPSRLYLSIRRTIEMLVMCHRFGKLNHNDLHKGFFGIIYSTYVGLTR